MKIDRLVSIIMTLLERDRVGAQELAEQFEVSPRTIYRDVDAINMAGIPVRSVSGVGGGFEIMREFKVDKKIFSSSDLSAILMGLSNLSTMIRGDELVNALAKVKSFIPADSARDIELKASQIRVDFSPWIGNRNIQPYLEIIRTALQERRLLSFDYTGRSGDRLPRTVEPYQLVLKSSHWYLQGYCLARNDFRLFKLTRMAGLALRAEGFTPRAYQPPDLGIIDAPEGQIKITLRIHRTVLERVLDYCTDEDVSPDGDGYFTVRFPFIENDYCYDILLGFGDRCECLEPPRVRAEMKRRSRAVAALYEDAGN
jgi:predicted DNA-binding transcriptional regulator YafY